MIEVPFSCYPKEVQEAFALNDLKLDLSGNDRTEESWGFIENKGASFVLYSYKPLTQEDFVLLNQILFGNKNGTTSKKKKE